MTRKNHTIKYNKNRGVTLIEVLLYIALLSILTAGVFSSIFSIIFSEQKGPSNSQENTDLLLKKYNSGFVALTLVIMISSMLLALVAASSIDSALFFDQALRKEYREMNYYYAGDCIDQAILFFAHDYFYYLMAPLEIPRYHCIILSIIAQDDVRIISTKGNFQNADVYRTATIRLHDQSLDIIKIE